MKATFFHAVTSLLQTKLISCSGYVAIAYTATYVATTSLIAVRSPSNYLAGYS